LAHRHITRERDREREKERDREILTSSNGNAAKVQWDKKYFNILQELVTVDTFGTTF